MKNYFAHETAVIDDGAQIGAGTKVWHFCHLMPTAIVGEDCSLGQNVYVGKARLGNGVRVQNNVSLYDSVICENDVFIGPSAVFTNVLNPRATVDRKKEYQTTLVKTGATIGANATIICGVTIGRHAFVGAGAVVTHDVPDYAQVVGNPARQNGWRCELGCALNFDEKGLSNCAKSGATYQLKQGMVTRTDAL